MGHPKMLLDLTAAEQDGLPLQVVCPTCGKSVNPEELTIDEEDEELAIESVATCLQMIEGNDVVKELSAEK